MVAGNGIASVSPEGPNQVYIGTGIRLSCVVQAGYFFKEWQNGAGTVISRQQDFTLANVTASDTITAVGIEDTTDYTVIIISNAAGVTGVSGAGTYRFGTVKQISCTVASGYNFVAWCENNALGEVISNSREFSLTVNRDITLYPLCESQGGDSWFMYFAIVQPAWGHIEDGDGVTFNNGDWFEFIDGELEEYIAVPASGYEFVKWLFNGKDFSGNTNRQITWTYDPAEHADGTLTAVFQEAVVPTTYTLHLYCPIKDVRVHYTINGQESYVDFTQAGGSEHTISVPMNATVVLRAEYRGSDVVSWRYWYDYASSVPLSTDSSHYSFTMNGEKYISASYS